MDGKKKPPNPGKKSGGRVSDHTKKPSERQASSLNRAFGSSSLDSSYVNAYMEFVKNKSKSSEGKKKTGNRPTSPSVGATPSGSSQMFSPTMAPAGISPDLMLQAMSTMPGMLYGGPAAMMLNPMMISGLWPQLQQAAGSGAKEGASTTPSDKEKTPPSNEKGGGKKKIHSAFPTSNIPSLPLMGGLPLGVMGMQGLWPTALGSLTPSPTGGQITHPNPRPSSKKDTMRSKPEAAASAPSNKGVGQSKTTADSTPSTSHNVQGSHKLDPSKLTAQVRRSLENRVKGAQKETAEASSGSSISSNNSSISNQEMEAFKTHGAFSQGDKLSNISPRSSDSTGKSPMASSLGNETKPKQKTGKGRKLNMVLERLAKMSGSQVTAPEETCVMDLRKPPMGNQRDQFGVPYIKEEKAVPLQVDSSPSDDVMPLDLSRSSRSYPVSENVAVPKSEDSQSKKTDDPPDHGSDPVLDPHVDSAKSKVPTEEKKPKRSSTTVERKKQLESSLEMVSRREEEIARVSDNVQSSLQSIEAAETKTEVAENGSEKRDTSMNEAVVKKEILKDEIGDEDRYFKSESEESSSAKEAERSWENIENDVKNEAMDGITDNKKGDQSGATCTCDEGTPLDTVIKVEDDPNFKNEDGPSGIVGNTIQWEVDPSVKVETSETPSSLSQDVCEKRPGENNSDNGNIDEPSSEVKDIILKVEAETRTTNEKCTISDVIVIKEEEENDLGPQNKKSEREENDMIYDGDCDAPFHENMDEFHDGSVQINDAPMEETSFEQDDLCIVEDSPANSPVAKVIKKESGECGELKADQSQVVHPDESGDVIVLSDHEMDSKEENIPLNENVDLDEESCGNSQSMNVVEAIQPKEEEQLGEKPGSLPEASSSTSEWNSAENAKTSPRACKRPRKKGKRADARKKRGFRKVKRQYSTDENPPARAATNRRDRMTFIETELDVYYEGPRLTRWQRMLMKYRQEEAEKERLQAMAEVEKRIKHEQVENDEVIVKHEPEEGEQMAVGEILVPIKREPAETVVECVDVKTGGGSNHPSVDPPKESNVIGSTPSPVAIPQKDSAPSGRRNGNKAVKRCKKNSLRIRIYLESDITQDPGQKS